MCRFLMFLLQLPMGKMMEQGPVLIITFQAQLVMVIRNVKGEVVEGDPVSNGLTSHCKSPLTSGSADSRDILENQWRDSPLAAPV